MKRVFVDTGAFFAYIVGEDDHHERATALLRQAAEEGWELVTTNVVVYETYTLLLKRARNGRAAGLGFLDDVRDGVCTVEWVTEQDEANAIKVIRGQDDKDYSFFDVLSFMVMQRLRITEAIAFDRHFREYGQFAVL